MAELQTEMPQHYIDLVGKKRTFSGGLFSHKRAEPEKEYDILDWRWGSAKIVNYNEIKKTGQSSYMYPTVEYLIKSPDIKRSRWTRGFPVREINLKEIED
jgi:hypothetical protein